MRTHTIILLLVSLLVTLGLEGCSSTGFVVQSDIPGVAEAVSRARMAIEPTCQEGDMQTREVDVSANAKLTKNGLIRQTISVKKRCSK
jgi:hypothetical protein